MTPSSEKSNRSQPMRPTSSSCPLQSLLQLQLPFRNMLFIPQTMIFFMVICHTDHIHRYSNNNSIVVDAFTLQPTLERHYLSSRSFHKSKLRINHCMNMVATSTQKKKLSSPQHVRNNNSNNNNNHHNNNNRNNNKQKNNNKKKKKVMTYKDFKQMKSQHSTNTIPSSTSTSSTTHTRDTAPYQQQQQQQQSQKLKDIPPISTETRGRIHTIHDIKSSRTKEETKRSNKRLDKARRLLENFVEQPSTLDDLYSTKFSAQQTTKPSSPMNQTLVDTDNDNDDDDNYKSNKVPDSFWYNGNLQGKGDYVTRWAQGVKVAEPLRKYDPEAAEQLLFLQPTKWLVRNIQIGFPLALWATGVVFDIITNQEVVNRPNRAKQLLKTISGLGPAIIKGGQALASRSDLMPSEYLVELQKLQDDVPRFDNDLAFQTVEEELGIDFDDVFELVYDEPIAAASIGQVYKARLRSNNNMIALKIQRPNCEEVIALDLYVLRWWSGVANIITNLFNRDINVQSIIDDFGELIYRELDYVAEAANAQRFNQLYAADVKDVFVPKVYSELTTSKVLTMEWVDGFRLTDSDSLELYGLNRKKLVDTLVQCSLKQILENGFFHADPHAGNLLACPDGRLCYLDFGMMSYAAASQRNGFLLAVVHIVNRDWDELVRMYQRLGFIPEGTDLEPIAIALENSLPDALNSEVSELNFKNVVGKLGDIMYTYPFSLPPFYIAIIRCLGVLEGLAIQVDPQARIINMAYPYIASRVLTDPQNELQEALRRLALTNEGHIRWSRLENLLEKATDSQGYDVTKAVDQLTNYLISDDGEQLLQELSDQIVIGADSLGTETVSYVLEASRALLINDEAAALRAFESLQEIVTKVQDGKTTERIREKLRDALPEPTPSMKQFWRIITLLGARGTTTSSDPAKLLPILRKLGQERRIQRVASEIIARLSERALSRALRAAFGLSPPSNDGKV